MEDLYVENFSKQAKASRDALKSIVPSEIEHSETLKKSDDFLIDLSLCIERLEKEIEKQYMDYQDYRFIFRDLKEKIKQKKIPEIFPLLDDLEELLDLDLPAIQLKKNLDKKI